MLELFKNLIWNKTVAIVGPGASHGDYGAEIDQFETVIRIKFIGPEMLDLRYFHGTRTDISFIGAIAVLKLQEVDLPKQFQCTKLLISTQLISN